MGNRLFTTGGTVFLSGTGVYAGRMLEEVFETDPAYLEELLQEGRSFHIEDLWKIRKILKEGKL